MRCSHRRHPRSPLVAKLSTNFEDNYLVLLAVARFVIERLAQKGGRAAILRLEEVLAQIVIDDEGLHPLIVLIR